MGQFKYIKQNSVKIDPSYHRERRVKMLISFLVFLTVVGFGIFCINKATNNIVSVNNTNVSFNPDLTTLHKGDKILATYEANKFHRAIKKILGKDVASVYIIEALPGEYYRDSNKETQKLLTNEYYVKDSEGKDAKFFIFKTDLVLGEKIEGKS